jgi:sarcosine/dimethylglycine N-methyltransferase
MADEPLLHYHFIYDDQQADKLYQAVWGENLHFGLYTHPAESMAVAMLRTKQCMTASLGLTSRDVVLEVGCGFGAMARFLAQEYGCQVVATNYSRQQLARAQVLLQSSSVTHLVRLAWTDYHHLPYDDAMFDYWWCQEAITHSKDKRQVFREAYRVLKPGGKAVLSDQLVRQELLTPDERERIATRHGSDDLWHAAAYQRALEDCGLRIERYEDWSAHIAPHFAAVARRVEEQRAALATDIDAVTIQHNYNIWRYWSQAGQEGKIGWGYFVAVKDA